MRKKTRKLCGTLPLAVAMRYADGGSTGGGAAHGDMAAAQEGKQNQEGQPAQPAKAVEDGKAAQTYTEQQLQEARSAAVEEYKRHLEEAQDYEKMTAEEKVAYLERQHAEEKLERYAVEKLTAAGLTPDFARYVKAPDEKAIEGEIKHLKALFDKGVQAGVEARFKHMGYEPRGSGIGRTATQAARARGVTIE